LNADAAFRRRLPLLALASVLMGVGLYFAAWALAPFLADSRLIVGAAVIAALVLFGVILFALFCQVTGAVDFRQIVTRLRRRT
jgi:putative peptidoglycan lipid II flippase